MSGHTELLAYENSGGQSISTIADLQPNIVYCDTQEVSDSVTQAAALTQLVIPSSCSIKVIRHCLTLRLLHYYGPFNNPSEKNLILIASCLYDESRTVLISIKLPITNGKTVNLDQHINRTFTLKNFMTIQTTSLVFNSGRFNSTNDI